MSQTPQTHLVGVFVVFEMRERGRNAPDTTNAPTRVCLWCSRQGEEWEHAVHHKRAHEGMFGVFEMRGRGGNMPDTTNTPTRRVCGV